MEDILFDLYYSVAHRNEELEQTIEELQNDLNQARNEIKLLNKQIDRHITAVNDLTDIIDELKKENNRLKFRNKMSTKIGFLNSIYGSHCCKNHCVYTDTDSIKSESEDK